MDLLCNAYGDLSDQEEGEGEFKYKPPQRHVPASKRPRLEAYDPPQRPAPMVTLPSQTSGRYVSKRERAILAAAAASESAACAAPHISYPLPSTVDGSILDSDVPSDILNLLKYQKQAVVRKSSSISTRLSVSLTGHSSAVNSIQWSKTHGHLLASAGMDQTVNIWNVWNRNQQKARALQHHNAAVKDVRWSAEGFSLLSCGYDCTSRLVDVEKGVETQMFKEDQSVEVIRFHPDNYNLFLSGGSRGILRLWDIRVGAVVKDYDKGLGTILDVEFSPDGKNFISSTDTSMSRISENTIIVWDVMRQVPLSNQFFTGSTGKRHKQNDMVYAEAYTCTCVRYHPCDRSFIAQSNGNYIAIFSARAPFKLDKYKRYENHGVWGFPIKCNFSLDGEQIASGSSDGSIYVYNYKSSELQRQVKAFEQACIDVAFHPSMPGVIASCSWTGGVSVFG